MERKGLLTLALAFVVLSMQAQEKTVKTISLSSLINSVKKQSDRQPATPREEEKTVSLSSLMNGTKKRDSQPSPALTITAKGIFGEQKLLIGSAISALPKTFTNLYDSYAISTEDDEGETTTIITFTLNGKETITAISYDQNTIANIDVITPNVCVLVGSNYYTCGSRMSSLKGESGTTTDDYGNVSYQNMYFDEDTEGNICAIHI